MPETNESRKPHDIERLVELAYLIFFLGFCSWAKDFLLPIVLATLISFLIAPLVSRLEGWGFHSAVAVFAVVAVAFALIGAVCTTVSVETLNLANSLPKYTDNIRARWEAIQKAPPGPMNAAFRNVGELIAELSKSSSPNQTSRYQFEPVFSRWLCRLRFRPVGRSRLLRFSSMYRLSCLRITSLSRSCWEAVRGCPRWRLSYLRSSGLGSGVRSVCFWQLH